MAEETHALEEEADRLFGAGKYVELLELAERVWPADNSAPLPVGMAEVCRFARLAAIYLLEALPPDHPTSLLRIGQKDLWEARCMTAAMLAGDRNVVAGLLLSRFLGPASVISSNTPGRYSMA